jgi:hypothetical protein
MLGICERTGVYTIGLAQRLRKHDLDGADPAIT